MQCRICGKHISEVGGYLARVTPKGGPAEWECRPNCQADLPEDVRLVLAIEADDQEVPRG